MSGTSEKKELSHLRLVRYGAVQSGGPELGRRRIDMAHEEVLPSKPEAGRDVGRRKLAKQQRAPQQKWVQTVAGGLSGSVVGVALGGAPGMIVLGALGALAGRATAPAADEE
jgi:hypothetical protein